VNIRVIHGDCIEAMAGMESESISAIVTDPPAGISFMNRAWDHHKGGRDQWVAWMTGVAREAWRVCKPGTHAFVWTLPRTSHWTAWAWEDANWTPRDVYLHIFGSGFPKSQNLDGEWQGWGTAAKPAHEDWWLFRKPLSEPTIAANVLRWGTGAINVDSCRVPTADALGGGDQSPRTKVKVEGWDRPWMQDAEAKAAHAERVNGNVAKAQELGRWPSNTLHDGSPEVLAAFGKFGTSTSTGGQASLGAFRNGDIYGKGQDVREKRDPGLGDTGTAARFFYCAKADAADRRGSRHPTVKPVALMRWLCRLITPPGGTVLDPFAGSGTTLEAALLEGFAAIGIEQSAEYVEDCNRRLAHMRGEDAPLFAGAA
jgi:DNA modification methylase